MDTRERILSCAEELFCMRGYDAVGVQEIVERAGITKPTLYYYFGSKRGLLEYLLAERFEKLQQLMKDMIPGNQADIRQKLHAAARECYRFFLREPKFYRLMMALLYSPRENEAYLAAAPYARALYSEMTRIFQTEAASLGNMHGRQEQFASSFIGVVNQFLMVRADRGELREEMREEGEKQLSALVDQYMYGIFS